MVGSEGLNAQCWVKGGRRLFIHPNRVSFIIQRAVSTLLLLGLLAGLVAVGSVSVSAQARPGDRMPLREIHPSYDREIIRPEGFTPRVGGIDFLSDGRMVLLTWDGRGNILTR